MLCRAGPDRQGEETAEVDVEDVERIAAALTTEGGARLGIGEVATLTLIGERPEQQDAVGHLPFTLGGGQPGRALLLADGHGDDGAEAAAIAVRDILRGMLDVAIADAPLDPRVAQRSFAAAHRDIVASCAEGGAAATYAALCGDRLLVAWAGNAEARLCKRDGHLQTLALPHEFGVHPGETQRLLDMGAEIVDPNGFFTPWGDYKGRPGPLRRGHIQVGMATIEMSRALGDPDFDPFVAHVPEVREVTLGPEDRFLVVASDGLWHCLRRAERRHSLQEVLAAAPDADGARDALCRLVSRWRLSDNLTVAVVGISGP